MKNSILMSIICSISFVCAADKDEESLIIDLSNPTPIPLLATLNIAPVPGPLTGRTPRRKSSPRYDGLVETNFWTSDLEQRTHICLPADEIISIVEHIIGCRPVRPGCKPTPYSLARDGKVLFNMAVSCKQLNGILSDTHCVNALIRRASKLSGIPPYTVAGLFNTHEMFNYLDNEKKMLLDSEEPIQRRAWSLARFIQSKVAIDRLALLRLDEDMSRTFVRWIEETVNQAGENEVFQDAWTTNMVPFGANTFLYSTEKETSVVVGSIAKMKRTHSKLEDATLENSMTSSISASDDTIWIRQCRKVFSSRLAEGDYEKQILLAFIQKEQDNKTALCICKKQDQGDEEHLAQKQAPTEAAIAPDAYRVVPRINFDTLQDPVLSNVLWHKNKLIAQGIDNKNMFVIKLLPNPDGTISFDSFLAQKPVNDSQEVRSMAIDEDGNIYVGNFQTGSYVTNVDGWWGGYMSWFKKIFLINYFRKKLGYK